MGRLQTCPNHIDRPIEGTCSDCGQALCSLCLVPPVRPTMKLRCVECALVAAGVRSRRPRHTYW